MMRWTNKEAPRGTQQLRWPHGMLPLVQLLYLKQWGGFMVCCHVACIWWYGDPRCCHVACTWWGGCWCGPVGECHVAYPCWHGLTRCCHVSLSGGVAADVDQQVSATWHVWGPLVRYPRQCGSHLCWPGPIGLWHMAVPCWPDPLWCCHVAHPLSSLIFYSQCFSYPVCTQSCCCLQVVPRVALIKSQPLINPFNLFYLLWIYFNSSTYPKIMKFSSKISKFMMITPVFFNSIFAPISLH
jgi:hypothetical protein